MSIWKYYAKIERAKGEAAPRGPGARPEFDFDKSDGFFKRLRGSVQGQLTRAFLWFFRVFLPNPRFLGLVVVTRAADVCEALQNRKAFQVPFALEMIELGGANTVLAMDDCPHDKLRGHIDGLIRRDDDEKRVRADVAEVAKALIANAGGRLDVAGDLITRCATESCARYFGLEIDNPVAFADWATALSRVLFADPFGNKNTRAQALYASRRLREIGKRAIADARMRDGSGDTLADRFIAAQAAHPELTDEVICATLVGTTTGYIPTTALAAVKMLEELLRRPDAWRQARAAALEGRREDLWAILMEAGRLNPALFPGQWRYAREEALIAAKTLRQRRVRKGDVVLVATGAALSDGRQFPSPRTFDAKRSQQPDLLFGHCSHHCLGDFIAKAMLTEVFTALLSLDGLQPAPDKAGKLRRSGAFPRQWDWVFAPPNGLPPRVQSMSVVCVPISRRGDADEDAKVEREIRDLVAELGNPGGGELARGLKATNVIHFASLTVADLGEPEKPVLHLLLEINADGAPEVGLKAMAVAAGRWLEPILARALNATITDVCGVLRSYNLESHAKPWSTTHLSYNGVEELPVSDIAQQDGLARLCQRATDWYVRSHIGRGRRPMEVLRFVRRLIRGLPDPERIGPAAARAELVALLAEAEAYRAFVTQPARRRLKLAQWVDITINQARIRTAFSPHALPIWLALLGVWLILATGVFFASVGWDLRILGRLFLAGTVALLGELVTLALAGWGTLALLRAKEKSDPHDSRHVDLDHLKACTANEDAPGYAHNHFVATPTLKKGLFRRFTLAAALWGIGTLIVYGFRPGFVLNMGTIHYAKWFRPPGSRRLVFYGNYDGSWDSYLEDFITKAHLGQTAGWSNCEGFPPTKYLVNEGAKDGDRFKRWVRRQQIPTGFWFSCFPHLTTERIRNNALIHDGLSHAHTDSAARAWLACFGSQQRPESVLETDDVQSLVFQGFGKLDRALCAVLALPDDPRICKRWLVELVGGSGYELAERDIAVTFGDAPGNTSAEKAAAVAFSAEGLRKLNLPAGGCDDGDGLATFPGVFRLGMSGRARTLGDDGDDAPERWRWADAAAGTTRGSDAVLMIYADSSESCRRILAEHLHILGQDALLYHLPTKPARRDDLNREHFGFRDAVSQPVIRGTERFVKGEDPNDVLEPGEFILGYRTNQGYFPPSPLVHADTDALRELPTAQAESPKRFPIFADGPHGAAFHDFGRNGSYLVLRQFEQHVESLNDFAVCAAQQLRETYPDIDRALGDHELTAQWIKAKLVGRWPNGVSLLDRPNFPGRRSRRGPDNGFAFGRDDPQGLRCPLGAHGRRANPRDSLDPGDKRGREISNRHRLLRRGRAYALGDEAEATTERGLLFACLCADLERQFEFVQQTWINSTSFHGLNNEADPLLRGHQTSSFTIPTPAGALRLRGLRRFVTVKGGGYYFLPSRSALAYLITRCAELSSVDGPCAASVKLG
ncbi:hypothetical protein [Phenylobacterium sp.]|uniref:hypothetical protein n=1 Tax=Phenylobacterium sp. TaxID=1871053 RepID=UPI003BA936E8